MNTIKWFMQEYRHEDSEGRYYLTHILKVWLSGVRYGFIVSLLPWLIWWILR